MVLREFHTYADYAHWTAGLDFTHCHAALSCSAARGSDLDHGRVEAKLSLNLDYRSALVTDPRFPCA